MITSYAVEFGPHRFVRPVSDDRIDLVGEAAAVEEIVRAWGEAVGVMTHRPGGELVFPAVAHPVLELA